MGSLSVFAVLACACSTPLTGSARDIADANDKGRTLSPKSAHERLVLQQVASLPSGTAKRIGNGSVVADTPYDAASGHTCRALEMTPENTQKIRHRLACTDGRGWFFVPEVLGDANPE